MKKEELAKKLIDDLKPYINMDGGNRLTGACQNCMYQDNTINDSILSYFKESIPDIEGIININI